MNPHTHIDNDRVQVAIAAAERGTSAEFVLAVTDVSDDYGVYPLLWATLAGFAALGALAFIWPDTHVRFAFAAAGIIALVFWLILHFTPLGLAMVPVSAKNRAARALAHLEFAERVAGRTAKANGLLIFVALRERHVEIVPDAGLARSVGAGAWSTVIATMAVALREGRPTDGVIAGIEACAKIAATVFPPEAGDGNEIEDAVVVMRHS